MKKNLLYCAVALLAASAFAAESTPKDEVKAAAKQLADKPNYAWKTTTENAGGGGGGGGPRGPSEGKVEKGGYAFISLPGRDGAKSDVYLKGDKGAVKTPDGWKSIAEMAEDQQGPGRFVARMAKNFKAPAVQAEDLAEKAKELKKSDEGFKGDLTEEGAKFYLTPGGRGEASDAKGSAVFWIKDGVLTKFSYSVQGKVSYNGNERDVDRTTTVEIKDVGTTKVEVPEEASKKTSS